MPTPRVIHFIWAGGEKPFPNHEVLKKWQEANPDCQIVLWVDKKSTSESVFEGYRKLGYKECGKDAPPIEGVIEKQLKPANDEPKPIVFSDITEAQVVTPHVRYEIDRFGRNYGSSSDILRCHILSKFGGAYFDSDIDPRYRISDHYDFDSGKPQFKVTSFTQGTAIIGNDAFICSQGHPLMQELFAFLLENYKKPSLHKPDEFDSLEKAQGHLTYRDRQTIFKTGPSAVKAFLVEKGIADRRKNYLPMRSEEYELSTKIYKSHTVNHRNWIKVAIKPCFGLKEAIDTAIEGMSFEGKVMKMGRFSDHVRDINLSLQEPLILQLKDLLKIQLLKDIMNPYKLFAEKGNEKEVMQLCVKEYLEETLGLGQEAEPLIKLLYDYVAGLNFREKTPEKLAEELAGMTAEVLLRHNHADVLLKDIEYEKVTEPNLLNLTDNLFKDLESIHIHLGSVKNLTFGQLAQTLKTLHPTSEGLVSAVEATFARVLFQALEKAAPFEPELKSAKFSSKDMRYGMPELLWAVTLPLRKGFEKSLEKAKEYLVGANEMFKHYQQMVRFNEDLNVNLAEEALKQVKIGVEKVEQFYQDTLSWWSTQEASPQTTGELEARLEEIQALCLNTKASYVEAQLETHARQKEPGTKGYIEGIRGAAEGHRGAAKGIRASLEAEAVVEEINKKLNL